MALRAGLAEVDITPPVGTHKIGCLRDIVSDRVLDPLCARGGYETTISDTSRLAQEGGDMLADCAIRLNRAG
jgi:hypothetical protein